MSKFSTRISARGSQGNVFAILGNATSLLRQLKLHAESTILEDKVLTSESYEEAVGHVREYFPVDI